MSVRPSEFDVDEQLADLGRSLANDLLGLRDRSTESKAPKPPTTQQNAQPTAPPVHTAPPVAPAVPTEAVESSEAVAADAPGDASADNDALPTPGFVPPRPAPPRRPTAATPAPATEAGPTPAPASTAPDPWADADWPSTPNAPAPSSESHNKSDRHGALGAEAADVTPHPYDDIWALVDDAESDHVNEPQFHTPVSDVLEHIIDAEPVGESTIEVSADPEVVAQPTSAFSDDVGLSPLVSPGEPRLAARSIDLDIDALTAPSADETSRRGGWRFGRRKGNGDGGVPVASTASTPSGVTIEREIATSDEPVIDLASYDHDVDLRDGAQRFAALQADAERQLKARVLAGSAAPHPYLELPFAVQVGDELDAEPKVRGELDIDDLRAAPAQDDEEAPGNTLIKQIRDWAVVVVLAALAALVVQTYVVQLYEIPSESMYPTLKPRDRVLVNKLAYKMGSVQRGQLIVFKRPEGEQNSADDPEQMIKRVIGVPGDVIEARDGVVYIDGDPLDETGAEGYLDASVVTAHLSQPVTVKPGYLFVMGDNRESSRDSRFFGPIPEDSVIGRAVLIGWPPNRWGGFPGD